MEGKDNNLNQNIIDQQKRRFSYRDKQPNTRFGRICGTYALWLAGFTETEWGAPAVVGGTSWDFATLYPFIKRHSAIFNFQGKSDGNLDEELLKKADLIAFKIIDLSNPNPEYPYGNPVHYAAVDKEKPEMVYQRPDTGRHPEHVATTESFESINGMLKPNSNQIVQVEYYQRGGILNPTLMKEIRNSR